MRYISERDYNEYIHSIAWKERRIQRLSLDHSMCCVCGGKATDVHHLTYDHFKCEPMEDLVSLCHECHEKAEAIYDPAITPQTKWEAGNAPAGEDTFMASMRIDAENVSQIVASYLISVRGSDFNSLLAFRKPSKVGGKDYWSTLRNAVNALCRKRYQYHVEDRKDIATKMLTNRVATICLATIEHNSRNSIQASLHDIVNGMYESCGTWKRVAEELGVSINLVNKFKKDDGASGGPTLRETVFYYCMLDAAAGLETPDSFFCLTKEDYHLLKNVVEHSKKITGIEYLSQEVNYGN